MSGGNDTNFPALEVACPNENCPTRKDANVTYFWCDDCHGNGKKLTAFGAAVLKLIEDRAYVSVMGNELNVHVR